MHTPDGLITGWICIVMLIASLSILAYALASIRKNMNKGLMIKMGMAAMIIFAGQMINFPVASGTSGHLIGAALAAILLGPEAALIVLAAVLGIQAFVFGDGGVIALGVNIFNMAIVAIYAAHFVYQKSRNIAIASWASVACAALSASIMLSLSGMASAWDIFSAMLLVHAVIGIGEALITMAFFAYLNRVPASNLLPYLGAVPLVCMLALPFASLAPDGLEAVAINLGFYSSAVQIYHAPFADYLIYGSGLLGAAIGIAMAGSFTYAITRIVPGLQ